MGCLVNATPRPLYPRERPGTHCIGGWVGPRVGVDGCGKSLPPPGFDPRTVQPVASRYTDWVIPVHTGASTFPKRLQHSLLPHGATTEDRIMWPTQRTGHINQRILLRKAPNRLASSLDRWGAWISVPTWKRTWFHGRPVRSLATLWLSRSSSTRLITIYRLHVDYANSPGYIQADR